MIIPVIDKSFVDDLKLINPGLFLIWNTYLERYQVFHKDRRTGLTRIINTVEDDDGNYMQCDNRTLKFLRNVVCWDLMERFPEPKDMIDHMQKKAEAKRTKEFEDREDFRKEWNKAHRKYWKAAYENLCRGIVSVPTPTRTKTFSTIGVKPGSSTLILPKTIYD